MSANTRPASVSIFERAIEVSGSEHESVVFCSDAATGLRAIIGIHDTTLGPALGGTRFFRYQTEDDALNDVLRLSQGMTLKAAAAGLPFGGGKAVILAGSSIERTPKLLRAYGRCIEQLGGRYVTAADVGTDASDLDVIGQATGYVVGRSPSEGGSGDSGQSTAYGVFQSMVAAAQFVWGAAGLEDRHVGVEGAGKVGSSLVGLLLTAGARVSVADPHQPALERVLSSYDGPVVRERVIDAQIDVYAPCAMGSTLTERSSDQVHARIVCGAANNQLERPEVEQILANRGVIVVPDFIANAGGLIQVGSERLNRTRKDVKSHIRRIGTTVSEVLSTAERHGTLPGVEALALATARLQGGKATEPAPG